MIVTTSVSDMGRIVFNQDLGASLTHPLLIGTLPSELLSWDSDSSSPSLTQSSPTSFAWDSRYLSVHPKGPSA